MSEVLRFGMVGGGRDAFIGAVHRVAAGLDVANGRGARLVAGCLSSSPEKALASGRDLGLDASRNYPTWREMLAGELRLPRDQRIDFVSIVTPNHVHYEVAKAFAESGINVVCDKPLCHTWAQAADLVAVARRANVVFAVTYNYSGYPLVRQAREMVKRGEIGEIRKVVVEYNQGWLAQNLESTGQKQADWRTDPARSGAGGAIGDIGSHAEQLVATVTGLTITQICADLTSFVPGRRLDDDANLLLRLSGDMASAGVTSGGGGGARGVLMASQIEIGHENDLRLRVFGTRGSLDWRQEDPNALIHRPINEPERVLRRGNAYLLEAARANGATRLPPGHPEAFFEAFANVYQGAMDAIRRGTGFEERSPLYPTVIDGARGVRFIEAAVESSRSDRKWTEMAFIV